MGLKKKRVDFNFFSSNTFWLHAWNNTPLQVGRSSQLRAWTDCIEEQIVASVLASPHSSVVRRQQVLAGVGWKGCEQQAYPSRTERTEGCPSRWRIGLPLLSTSRPAWFHPLANLLYSAYSASCVGTFVGSEVIEQSRVGVKSVCVQRVSLLVERLGEQPGDHVVHFGCVILSV